MLAFITWDVSPIIAQIGPLTLRWYGLLFASGFIIGSFILTHIYKAERVSPRWVDVITIYMLIGTVLGARLGHVLFYDPAHYLAHPGEILKIWEGGLASHGATLGILLATWLFSRNNKFDYLWVLDRIVIVVATGGMCIRLGNLMNSEIIGRQTDVPWAFKFVRYNEIHHEVTNVPLEPHHPTQIYEALFCLFLFVLLYGLWNKYKERTPRGLLFGLFVTLLFTFRFLVEFLKENQEGFESTWALAPLNMGQVLSIPLVFVGLWVLLRAGKQPDNRYGYAPRDLNEPAAPAAKPVTR
ncbi:prolipoprotein diacylglyceryl transferase [Hymenobacter busanensis]|uniref:Phosphatidylglycerol--prolipoprotein diacylglyceryl transferase n=1 Tax=Hymenobacter busanensis TaxID=2607656 RepID=A0A7L4ZX83_9BACT|nr:prolipoprotein diacylglyceryl transferase [Hymenobacter busanensis]KAA9332217.1 prolipoprotein diacylglyceryl transferase [Hymenobacter busanensis]QHJ07445.1 prolipoprotein diacylglyceryl transferase [Hymenobacter busanensis]